MRQINKFCLWLVALVLTLQISWAFNTDGPLGNGGDGWQIPANGFNPLNSNPANPYGFSDNLAVGPKNIGEEYRANTPVLYYTFDENFTGYFGSHGTNAVMGAFAVFNSLTNVSSYSSGLTEFPFQSEGINYQAQALGLYDLKSLTMPLVLEQLGVGDSVRYTWTLHSRWHTGNTPCPTGENYLVTLRNYFMNPSSLNQLQYSPYVNGALYTYSIYENCAAPGSPNPIEGAALPLPVDALFDNPSVASGIGCGFLALGGYYTGLTQDDMAALRYLLQASNINTESPAAGSQVQSITVGAQSLLTTSDFTSLATSSVTNPPATVVGLFPGLVVASSTSYFTNILTPNVVTYTTNYPGEAFGTPPHVVTATVYTQTIATYYDTTFANVVTNSFQKNSSATLLTTTIGLKNGSPIGSPFVTNTTTKTVILTNVPSGDFYVIPAGTCGYNIIQKIQTNIIATTNLIVSSTNSAGASTVQSLVTRFTNHVFVVQQVQCPFVTPVAAKYEGIENIKFVGIDINQYDSLLGQFFVPITNNYTMSLYNQTNGVVTIQNFQRVLTAPDILFTATDQTSQGGAQTLIQRPTPRFNQTNVLNGLAGPGTIDPGTTITFNKSGPVFVNQQSGSLNGPNYGSGFIYASFDGTTNEPVIYPNGTSITDLEAQVFMQISPSTIPAATVGSFYTATLTVSGGQAPYTWSLATTSSPLPDGLTLSAGGVISGVPAQNLVSGIYDFIVQLNDSAAHILRIHYFITIN